MIRTGNDAKLTALDGTKQLKSMFKCNGDYLGSISIVRCLNRIEFPPARKQEESRSKVKMQE
jgi:hypothetical protein